MAFTEIENFKIKKHVGGLCEKLSPGHIRDKLRYEYKIVKHDVLLYEIRPQWNNPSEETWIPCAKIKFVRSRNEWTLYWHRADMKWHRYRQIEPSADLLELVDEIDSDPMGCFFG